MPKGIRNHIDYQKNVGFQSCNVRFNDHQERLKESLKPGPASYTQVTKENCIRMKLENDKAA